MPQSGPDVAAQARKSPMPVIGFLNSGSPGTFAQWSAAFRTR